MVLANVVQSKGVTNIANASIKDAAGIDPTKIANGSVTSTEFQHISTLTSNAQTQISAKAPLASPTFTGTVVGITKAMVGIGNVDNTSDANKPVSRAHQTALNLKSNKADSSFTGQCKFLAGSVSAPSITKTGDLNTGILFPAADTVEITTRGRGRFKVDNGGIEVVGAISSSGDITALTSDKRLKKNIKILSNPLDKLNVLSGFTYDWSLDKCSEAGFVPKDEEQIGVFAQDVQSVIPQAVKPAPFDTDSNGTSISGDNYLTVQYEKIVPLLIECIKEQQKQIDELKNKV